MKKCFIWKKIIKGKSDTFYCCIYSEKEYRKKCGEKKDYFKNVSKESILNYKPKDKNLITRKI